VPATPLREVRTCSHIKGVEAISLSREQAAALNEGSRMSLDDTEFLLLMGD
jgi:hypothetical protein